jgi:hypothetical protein
MWKRILLGILAIAVVGGGVAWLNRKAIVLFIASHTDKRPVGPNIPVPTISVSMISRHLAAALLAVA